MKLLIGVVFALAIIFLDIKINDLKKQLLTTCYNPNNPNAKRNINLLSGLQMLLFVLLAILAFKSIFL